MRDWLNALLIFIETTSLTDLEYASIDQTGMITNIYNQEAYDQLSAVLAGRESVSDLQARLIGIFSAKGLEVDEAVIAKTNIYLGDVL